MDIEGAEILALKGATSLLQQQRPHGRDIRIIEWGESWLSQTRYHKFAARLWLWFVPLQRRYQPT